MRLGSSEGHDLDSSIALFCNPLVCIVMCASSLVLCMCQNMQICNMR